MRGHRVYSHENMHSSTVKQLCSCWPRWPVKWAPLSWYPLVFLSAFECHCVSSKPESIILNALCKNVRTGKRNFEFMTSLWTKFPKWTYFLHKCPNTQVRRVIYLTLQIVFPDIIKSILTYFSRAQWELTRPTFMLWRWSFRLLLSSSVSQCSLLARRENRFITNNDPVAN